MNNRMTRIDFFFLFALLVFLILVDLFDLTTYLFKLPYVTLLGFYLIGKYARSLELKQETKSRGSEGLGNG